MLSFVVCIPLRNQQIVSFQVVLPHQDCKKSDAVFFVITWETF
jgi:hypothetical protein